MPLFGFGDDSKKGGRGSIRKKILPLNGRLGGTPMLDPLKCLNFVSGLAAGAAIAAHCATVRCGSACPTLRRLRTRGRWPPRSARTQIIGSDLVDDPSIAPSIDTVTACIS